MPTIEAIDQAIAAHAAACYALERQIDGDIEAGAVTTTAQSGVAFAGRNHSGQIAHTDPARGGFPAHSMRGTPAE